MYNISYLLQEKKHYVFCLSICLERKSLDKNKIRKDKTDGNAHAKQDITMFSPPTGSPLLQRRIGPCKSYTLGDMKDKLVWKGPFTKKKIACILFLNNAMLLAFHDKHTCRPWVQFPYIASEMLTGVDASMMVEDRVYVDHGREGPVATRKARFLSRKKHGRARTKQSVRESSADSPVEHLDALHI